MHEEREDNVLSAPGSPGPGDPAGGHRAARRDRSAGHLSTNRSDAETHLSDRFRYRAWLRRHKGLELVYRLFIAVLGTAIMIGGLALIPLPGPGWLIVFAGLAVLASEFEWAERLLEFGQDRLRAWTAWVLRQSLAVRALIGLLGLATVAGAVWLYVEVAGVPSWIPFIG